MFGYVSINPPGLTDEAKARYESLYCGLCRQLQARHGSIGRLTVSYDITFLLVMLGSLYEPDETSGSATCPVHPIKKRPFIISSITDYAADMNIALAYHKCLDDWQDERKPLSLMEERLLRKAYHRVQAIYPDKCTAIEKSIAETSRLEKAGCEEVDSLANQTASMLEELCVLNKGDPWEALLRQTGGALGRFIYLMDAYEDLPSDLRHRRFNPLARFATEENFDAFCHDGLTMMMAECTEAFEQLPLVQDIEILRNILYAGVWTRYAAILKKRAEKEGEHEPESI